MHNNIITIFTCVKKKKEEEDVSRKYVRSTGHVNQKYMTDNENDERCNVDDQMF